MSLKFITYLDVCAVLPAAPVANVKSNWPAIQTALIAKSCTRLETIMALSTVAAETASFAPVTEGISHYNTAPGGAPYALYDYRSDLGNKEAGDGAKYCGRGFIQITGKANYARFGPLVGIDLIANPEAANYSAVAANLLAAFLTIGNKRDRILHFAMSGDLVSLRKLVNGGSNGMTAFRAAWALAFTHLPQF